jgi:hypothetical protein
MDLGRNIRPVCRNVGWGEREPSASAHLLLRTLLAVVGHPTATACTRISLCHTGLQSRSVTSQVLSTGLLLVNHLRGK